MTFPALPLTAKAHRVNRGARSHRRTIVVVIAYAGSPAVVGVGTRGDPIGTPLCPGSIEQPGTTRL